VELQGKSGRVQGCPRGTACHHRRREIFVRPAPSMASLKFWSDADFLEKKQYEKNSMKKTHPCLVSKQTN
jgi:hypothetical protein